MFILLIRSYLCRIFETENIFGFGQKFAEIGSILCLLAYYENDSVGVFCICSYALFAYSPNNLNTSRIFQQYRDGFFFNF